MIKLFRKGLPFQAIKAVRGGHGWDAPPPPSPSIYEHKRIVNKETYLVYLKLDQYFR